MTNEHKIIRSRGSDRARWVMAAIGALALSLVFVSLGGGPALAGPAPAGSYQQTCQDIAVFNTGSSETWKLTARCRKRDQTLANSTKVTGYPLCKGDILNSNGVLQCALPGGSYQQSCAGSQMQTADRLGLGGYQLVASCKDTNGKWNFSTLRNKAWVTNGCDLWDTTLVDIGNLNGRLTCMYSLPSNTVQSGPGQPGSCYPSCKGPPPAPVGNPYR